jgi:WXG100 family type VII secretion target
VAAGDQLHGMTEALERAAAMAGTVSASIDGHRTSLRPAVEGLRGQWEGTARVAFEQAHASWDEGIARLVTALQTLGENTQFSSNSYIAANETNAANLSKVAGMGAFGGQLRA